MHRITHALALALALSHLATTASLAASTPQYQIPTTVKNVTQGGQYSGYQCGGGGGAMAVANGAGNISTADCEGVLAGWNGTYFNLEMTGWEDPAGDAGSFYRVVAGGSCEFAVRRAGGAGGAVFIGDGDIKPLINGSIRRASFGDGSRLWTTEGNMTCTTDSEPGALIEWTLRRSGGTD